MSTRVILVHRVSGGDGPSYHPLEIKGGVRGPRLREVGWGGGWVGTLESDTEDRRDEEWCGTGDTSLRSGGHSARRDGCFWQTCRSRLAGIHTHLSSDFRFGQRFIVIPFLQFLRSRLDPSDVQNKQFYSSFLLTVPLFLVMSHKGRSLYPV